MPDRTFVPIALVTLGVAAAMLIAMLVSTGGEFAFPLDDPYIYFQYATQNAHGAFFRYNDGDPATTGATSLLYLLALSPLAIVFRGTSLAVVAFALAVVFFFMTLRSIHRLATLWIGERRAWPVTLLTALSGPLAWGVFSGMETALAAWLTVRVVEETARLRPGGAGPGDTTGASFSSRRFVIWGALLALSRPEAAVLVVLLVLSVPIIRRDTRPLGVPGIVTLIAAAMIPFAVNLALTGSAGSMTLASKGAMYLPGTTPVTYLIETTQFFMHNLKGLFASGDATAAAWPSAYGTLVTFAAPLTLLMAVLGLFPAWIDELRSRRPGAAWAGALAAGTGLVFWAALVPINLHWNRYFLPYLPLVVLFVVAGIDRLARGIGSASPGHVRAGLLAFFFLSAAPIFLFFAAAYGWNCAEIRNQHIAMAGWIAAHTPRGAWIGTNDVGAIAYYGGRPVLDLHGLVSRDLAACKQVGSGAIYEYLEAMPASRRPGYLALIPGWYDPGFVRLHRPVRSQTLRRAMIAGSPLVLYEAGWRLAGSGDQPGPDVARLVAGRRLVDRLDVADLTSEAAHRYRLALLPGESASPVGILSSPGGGSPVVDGGRLVTDRESMQIELTPGRDAMLVVRSLGPVRARISVGDSPSIPIPPQPLASGESWVEAVVRIPGASIRSTPTPVTVLAEDGAYQEGGFTSFHYWFYQ